MAVLLHKTALVNFPMATTVLCLSMFIQNKVMPATPTTLYKIHVTLLDFVCEWDTQFFFLRMDLWHDRIKKALNLTFTLYIEMPRA